MLGSFKSSHVFRNTRFSRNPAVAWCRNTFFVRLFTAPLSVAGNRMSTSNVNRIRGIRSFASDELSQSRARRRVLPSSSRARPLHRLLIPIDYSLHVNSKLFVLVLPSRQTRKITCERGKLPEKPGVRWAFNYCFRCRHWLAIKHSFTAERIVSDKTKEKFKEDEVDFISCRRLICRPQRRVAGIKRNRIAMRSATREQSKL